MTSPSGVNPLRSRGHGTPGCLPVPDPAVSKPCCRLWGEGEGADTTSLLDMGEANVTGVSREVKE